MRVNLVEVVTAAGATVFEVRHEDVATVVEPIDLLVVSTCTGDYTPTSLSLVGALRRARGIDLEVLAREPEHDLRPTIPAWISIPVEDPAIGRLLVVEAGHVLRPDERLSCLLDALRDGLALAAARDLPLRKVWVPLVGTGDQGLPPDQVAEALVRRLKALAEGIPTLEVVAFFAHDATVASAVSDAVDRAIGRERVDIATDDLFRALRGDLRAAVLRVRDRLPPALVEELALLAEGRLHPSAVAVAVCGRSVCEAVVGDLLSAVGRKPKHDLCGNIEALAQAGGLAPWMISYFHTLRTLGNAAAHVARPAQTPARLAERDLALALSCMHRVLTFWNERAMSDPAPAVRPT